MLEVTWYERYILRYISYHILLLNVFCTPLEDHLFHLSHCIQISCGICSFINPSCENVFFASNFLLPFFFCDNIFRQTILNGRPRCVDSSILNSEHKKLTDFLLLNDEIKGEKVKRYLRKMNLQIFDIGDILTIIIHLIRSVQNWWLPN